MFERFTERARRVLTLSQDEARQLGHNFIGTEHLLLGLIREQEGVGAQALERLGISLEATRDKVKNTLGRPSTVSPGGSPPFTPRAKKVLELGLREALQLGHNDIGTEHILLGLVREGEGVAAGILVDLGADLSRVRQQVVQLLAGYPSRAGDDLRAEPRRLIVASSRPTEPSGDPPDCPDCRSSLRGAARIHRLELGEADTDSSHAFIVVYCGACGHSLAFKAAD